MKSDATKQKFIQLRAEGLSYAKISEQLHLSFGGNPGCTDKEIVTISQPCAAQRMPISTREQTQRP